MDFTNLSIDQRLSLLKQCEKEEQELSGLFEETKQVDPYWWYEPSDGAVSEEGVNLLKKWIKPEDIPATFYGMDKSFKSTARIIGNFGANQVGKSVLNAVKAHCKITGDVPKAIKGIIPEWKLPKKWPVYGRIYGLSNELIEEVIAPKFKEWMPRSYMKDGMWEKSYNKQEKILRYYKDGKKFIGQVKFMSCEKQVSKSQGASLWFAHFDEEPPKEFYDECLPRFVANGGKGLDIEFFMTPTNGLTWTFTTLLKKSGQDGNIVECFKFPIITNKYADFNTVDKMAEDLDTYEERKMRLLGEFVSLSGLIYSGSAAINPAIHMIDPFELDHNKYTILRGLDPHLAKPTACVEIAVDRAGIIYVIGAYQEKSDIEEVKRDLATRVVNNRYRLAWTVYDKSLDYEIKALSDINIIDQYKKPPNPIPAMLPSEKFEGSIKAGVDAIKQYLKPDQFTKKPKIYFFKTKEVWKLVEEMQTLERDRSRNEMSRGIKDKIKEGPKDLHAAMRYIFQKPLEWIPPEGPLNGTEEQFFEERFI